MEYRDLGNTGMRASVIGLGAEHLDNKPFETARDTIQTAAEGGVNIMDVFMPGREVRENIGRALAGSRKDWIIQGHIGSVDTHQQYDISRDLALSQRYFEDLLRYLNTDYIDIGMIHCIDTPRQTDAVLSDAFLGTRSSPKRPNAFLSSGA
ncbi:MAG TPA: hypothetical protein DEB31_09850 [Clostridiales bacterium]|nr:hypothetical protein [Clostridiales bacterium]